jgi:hypothetical protein
MKICVYGCPGKGGEAEPHVFYLGARRLPVLAILDRWGDNTHRYFEVKAGDGRCFLLRYTPQSDCWELAAVYRTPKSKRPRVATVRA